jgi:kynurenine formamidase
LAERPLHALLAEARVYDLEQPRFQGAPTFPAHEPGFVLALHRRHEPGGGEPRTSASALLTMAEHSGTHIDAFCHQAVHMRMHGGVAVDPAVQTSRGFTRLGADEIPPLCARGVLLDLPALGAVPHHVPAEHLARAAAAHGEPRPGDVVLVRTGNGAHWEDRARYEGGPGIAPSASRWLAERQPLAVGADNLAWDLPDCHDPELGCTLPGHVILLVRAGVYILENLNLESLARDGVHEFAFICLPLKMRGATGSPVRPVAMVEKGGAGR